MRFDDPGFRNLRNELRRVEMIIRYEPIQLIAEAEADGTVTVRRIIVIDGVTGERVQVWPEVSRPVLSVPIPAKWVALVAAGLRTGETAPAGFRALVGFCEAQSPLGRDGRHDSYDLVGRRRSPNQSPRWQRLADVPRNKAARAPLVSPNAVHTIQISI